MADYFEKEYSEEKRMDFGHEGSAIISTKFDKEKFLEWCFKFKRIHNPKLWDGV